MQLTMMAEVWRLKVTFFNAAALEYAGKMGKQ